ncbi:hypothetical protein [Pseudomonas sp. CGJS7]|uniref:hypothetical protein n=1 Tax=Pseudomonas sp. CGJS7 TaxID=3109348 RepID=UPI00300B3E24
MLAAAFLPSCHARAPGAADPPQLTAAATPFEPEAAPPAPAKAEAEAKPETARAKPAAAPETGAGSRSQR